MFIADFTSLAKPSYFVLIWQDVLAQLLRGCVVRVCMCVCVRSVPVDVEPCGLPDIAKISWQWPDPTLNVLMAVFVIVFIKTSKK